MITILTAALAAPPAAMEHPSVQQHFSGHVSVWGPDGMREQAGTHDADAVFFIGSLSKQFTAVAALTLVDEGKLALDAPVATYFADVPDDAWTLQGEACTVQRLLRATCGVPRGVWAPGDEPGHLDDPALGRAYLADLADAGLLFVPGERHLYSNAGYDLAGLLVAEVAGMPLADALRQQVLDPLELHDTGLGLATFPAVEARLQRGELLMGAWLDAGRWAGLGPQQMASLGASGAMWSTGRDLARWTQALHRGELLSPSSYEAWTTAEHDDYAMGVIHEGADEGGVVWHNGALSPHGYSSYLSWLPAQEEVVVVLGHRDRALHATDATRLGARIEEERLGKAPKLDRLDTGVGEVALTSLRMAALVFGLPLAALALPGLLLAGPRRMGWVAYAGYLLMAAGWVSLMGSLRWGATAATYGAAFLAVAAVAGWLRRKGAPFAAPRWQDTAGAVFVGVMGLGFAAATPGGPYGHVGVAVTLLFGVTLAAGGSRPGSRPTPPTTAGSA